MTVTVRDATEQDLPAVVAIVNHVIDTSDAVWLDEPYALEDRRAWFRSLREQDLPLLVAVDGDASDEVVGWASFVQFRALAGYFPTVEHTLHVHDRWRGQGVGTLLMDALTERARDQGRSVQVAGLDAGNTGSQRFHERIGFVETARMPGLGRKRGRPVDLVLLQRDVPPRPAGVRS